MWVELSERLVLATVAALLALGWLLDGHDDCERAIRVDLDRLAALQPLAPDLYVNRAQVDAEECVVRAVLTGKYTIRVNRVGHRLTKLPGHAIAAPLAARAPG